MSKEKENSGIDGGVAPENDDADDAIEEVVPEVIEPESQEVRKGRKPTYIYKSEYCKRMIQYFTIKEPFKLVSTTKSYYQDGAIKTDHQEKMPTPPPFFEGFARKIGVTTAALHSWREKYPEFAEAWHKCEELRRELIISNGLIGLYDSKFTQFASKNMEEIGWKDEVTTTVKVDGKSLDAIWQKRLKAIKNEAEKRKQIPPSDNAK